MQSNQARIVRKQAVVCTRDEENHVMLYDPATDQFYVANPAGLLIWEMCDGSRCASQIKEEIAADYTASEDALNNIDRFIAFLLDKRLASLTYGPTQSPDSSTQSPIDAKQLQVS